MSITVQNLTKRSANDPILDRLNFTIPTGSIVALTGISGSGKTTLLRILAGLEAHDNGRILTSSPPVYAHPAPLRKLTVRENIAFGLQIRHRSKSEIQARVEDVLHFFNLQELGDCYPDKLSAGHRHRMALGRVMVLDPAILLLDEPFTLLDPATRQRFSYWLRQRADRLETATLFVSRDFQEVREICNSVLVLHGGKIAREYSPIEPYDLLALQTSLELEERKRDYTLV
jgi:sulfate transport system ATP-binding protein